MVDLRRHSIFCFCLGHRGHLDMGEKGPSWVGGKKRGEEERLRQCFCYSDGSTIGRGLVAM